MKKVFLLLIGISFLTFQSKAQMWVDTTPQNKKVVLEEFTGIHCGYCPDGHKRANDLVTANPGKVILVNIHSGGYAVPSGSEPDFRTTEGTAIDGAAGITGYPSGSINRSTSPWGQSRANWASLSNQILAQSSPVNVFVKSYVDFPTRTLTTEVEVYYTGNSTKSSNYLTVDLLQNEYLGPQSDYGNYNPTNWVNGLYKHNHFLRMQLHNGGSAFGEKLDTTTKGKYYYRKYVTVLPTTIKNVELFLYKLQVVAFVAESNAQIYTGAEADVEFDPNLKTDLGLVDKTVKPTSLCFTSVNPLIEVTNNMDQVVTKFVVTAKLNTTSYTKVFNGSLAKNDKTTVDFGTIPYVPTGNYSISFSGFDSINNSALFDMDGSNNTSSFSGIGFTQGIMTFVDAGFDVATMPANFAFDMSQNTKFGIVLPTSGTLGARGSKGAVRYALHDSWGMSGKPGDILFGEIDLTSFPDAFLTYYYAYSDDAYGGTAPVINVSVSDNCGQSWTPLRSITCVQTGNPTTHGNYYIPPTTDYTWVGSSLSAYSGKRILVKISGVPGTSGNSLYIDEISVYPATGISDNTPGTLNVSLYPNPVTDLAELEYGITKESPVTIKVYNTLNQLVYSKVLGTQTPGVYNTTIETSGFESGLYFMTITAGDNTTSKKFIKK